MNIDGRFLFLDYLISYEAFRPDAVTQGGGRKSVQSLNVVNAFD